MFTQILHHTYKLGGEAIDVSGNDNYGQRTDTQYVVDGRSSDTGALEYTQPSSDVAIPVSSVWKRLRALKIEMWVKLQSLGQRRNLVEGDNCFAFFVRTDGTLRGTILAPPRQGANPTWHGADSENNAPDGTTREVPVGQWVRLSFLHDGLSSLKLYIDGQLVAANYNMYGAVGSVQSRGVNIGHWTLDDRYTFSGSIDDVKVWKYDQEAALEQFFCRPMDSEQMACWKEIFDRMGEATDDPERWDALIKTASCLWREMETLLREARSQGEEAQRTHREFVQRYRDLWCCGAIGGPSMRSLLEEWFAWLMKTVGEARIHSFQNALWGCYQEYGIDEWLTSEDGPQLAECDPAFVEYMNLVHEVFGGPTS